MERTYPVGVPCWIDLEQPDVDAAAAFYTALLGWQLEDRMPPGSPYRYAVASLDGAAVGALCGPPEESSGGDLVPSGTGWQTYVAVGDAEAAAQVVPQLGGRVLQPPTSAGPAGTSVVLADPSGVVLRLWQPGERTGVQAVDRPGAWSAAQLRTDEPGVVEAFHAHLLGWRSRADGRATVLSVPGWADHLAATLGTGAEEQRSATPDRDGDVVGAVLPRRRLEDGTLEEPHWDVVVAVADLDDAVRRAERLGATVLLREDEDASRTVVVRDPQGAVLTLSQPTPPTPRPEHR